MTDTVIKLPDKLIRRLKSVTGKRSVGAALRVAVERTIRAYAPDAGEPSEATLRLIRRNFPQQGKGNAKSLFDL